LSNELLPNKFMNPYEILRLHRVSLENPIYEINIINWVNDRFGLQAIPRKAGDNSVLRHHICEFDNIHMSQALRKSYKPSKTMIFVGDSIKRMKRLAARIDNLHFAVIDKKSASISIIDYLHEKAKYSFLDSFLVFATSLMISNNGLFIVIDYEFGLSRVYRVLYSHGTPCSLSFINDFSWKSNPSSVISGTHWICSTAVQNQLVMWEIFSGTIHHTLEFNEKIYALCFDEEYGTWVATETKGYFISINGNIISEIDLPEEVSQIEAIQLHSAQSTRAAVCGTVSGRVFILSPRFDTSSIEAKELPSEHQNEIQQIVIHPSLNCFITVDSKWNAYIWTAYHLSVSPLKLSL